MSADDDIRVPPGYTLVDGDIGPCDDEPGCLFRRPPGRVRRERAERFDAPVRAWPARRRLERKRRKHALPDKESAT